MPTTSQPVPRPLPVADLRDAARKFLDQPSGRLLASQVVVLAALRCTRERPDRTDLAIVAGVAAWWPLQEWLAHRYVLHAPPRRIAGREIDPKVARLHRSHHADPWNNVGLPLSFLIPAVPVHALVWAAVTPNRRRALTGMLAFGSATLVYEWTHFLTHTSYRPKRSWFRKLQRRHRLHHFKDENKWLGFTVPYVDDLFGTAPDPSTVATSPTVRTLGIESVA
jgi:hypothetical protein